LRHRQTVILQDKIWCDVK